MTAGNKKPVGGGNHTTGQQTDLDADDIAERNWISSDLHRITSVYSVRWTNGTSGLVEWWHPWVPSKDEFALLSSTEVFLRALSLFLAEVDDRGN